MNRPSDQLTVSYNVRSQGLNPKVALKKFLITIRPYHYLPVVNALIYYDGAPPFGFLATPLNLNDPPNFLIRTPSYTGCCIPF